LEEDTGKLNHPEGADYSLIDYNRSSIPLLELVTEPVITSAEEAKQFAEEYQLCLRELEVADASMEKGQMRCEANISIVPAEYSADSTKRLSGTKIEVKNLNSFRSLERAILYEVNRQTQALMAGSALHQETRGWNEAKGETYVMRRKETADDYRYFPDPDLGRLGLSWITPQEETHRQESRWTLFCRLRDAGANVELVHTVVTDPLRLRHVRALLAQHLSPDMYGLLVQWIGQEPQLILFGTDEIAAVLQSLHEGVIRPSVLKEALRVATPGNLVSVAQGIQKDHAVDNLDAVINDVLTAHTEEVGQYKAGKVQLFGFFVGQVRKTLAGKGDPVAIADKLKKKLE
jgi:aspartyl-tRNA(Asn)/glutamyl-tRNA(Gln) amidotransferase subunit B